MAIQKRVVRVGAKCHDHPPMISSPRTSGHLSLEAGIEVPAHLSLDKTVRGPSVNYGLHLDKWGWHSSGH